MKNWLLAPLFAGLLCGAVAANAQITPAKGGYLFRRKLQKGLAFNYAMETVIQAKGLPQMPSGVDASNQKMTTSMKMKVLSVEGKKAKVQVAASDLMMNGQKMQGARSAEVEMSERGQVSQGAMGGQGRPDEEIEYPEKPVKVGDVVPVKLKQFGASSIRFIGFKPYKGKDAALWQMPISISGKGDDKAGKSSGGQKISGVVSILISKEDGWPLSTTVTLDVSAQQSGQKITVKSTATIIRQ